MLNLRLLIVPSLVAVLIVAPLARAQGINVGKVSQPPPKPVPTGDQLLEMGKLSGQTYTNEHFGVSLTGPKGWMIMSPEELRSTREAAKSLFENEKNATLKQQLQASVERTTVLFSARKLPPGGTAAGFDASLVCAAERIPTAIVKTPHDYYTLLLHSMKLSQEVEAEVIEAFKTKRIGASDFGVYTIKLMTPRGVLLQKQMVLVKSPYVFGIVFTYTDEGDAAAFDGVMSSVRAR